MTTVPINWVTSDFNRWGIGLQRVLQAEEVDRNFWELKSAVENIIANPQSPIQIAAFSVSGMGLLITMTNGEMVGPLPLPILAWRWREVWAPFVPYLTLDVFSVVDVGIFLVLRDHTSAATFDPVAEDLSSNRLYQQLIAISLPSLTVTDGVNSVTGVTRLLFDGDAVVSAVTDGVAKITVVGGSGGPDVALLRTVSLSSANILGASATPVEIIPAPGAGNLILVLNSWYSYTYVSTTYSGGSNAGLWYGTDDTFAADAGSMESLIHSTSSKAGPGGPAIALGFGAYTEYSNQPVTFTCGSAFTVGNGTLKISVVYAIVPI